MTSNTKWRLRFHQKVLLIRTMGEMTGRTALLPHFMSYLLFIILLLVTLKASFVPFGLQKVTELGSMGVMTLTAFPSLQSSMDIRFIHPYLILTVAGIADFVAFFLEDELRNQSVPEMAILAFLVFDGCMDCFHC